MGAPTNTKSNRSQAAFKSTPLRQRDPRWTSNVLGVPGQVASDSTIGNYGCAITSLANLVNQLIGTDVYTPPDVNNALLKVNGFANGNLVIWPRIPLAFPMTKFVNFMVMSGPLTPAQFDMIDSRVGKGVPVIVCVDSLQRVPGLQTHYVAITGWNGDLANHGYQINDPYIDDRDDRGNPAAAPLCPRYGTSSDTAICKILLFDNAWSLPDVTDHIPSISDYDKIEEIRESRALTPA